MLLAREALWRLRRRLRRRHLLAELRQETCPVSFRNLPYYRINKEQLGNDTRAITVRFADEICHGRFPWLGYGTFCLGKRPNWHADFVTGYEWPNLAMENRGAHRHDGADIKVPHELSRLQFLPVLGKAHVLTGEERYRELAKDLVSDWIHRNPFGIGINWTLAMEAALRGLSLCFLLNLLSPFRPDEQTWMLTVTRSLWEHLIYIEAHSEFSYRTRSNHFLSNLLGGYGLSLFLEGRGMESRRDSYRRRLQQEISQQTYKDGGDYEASLGYHVLVMQMFITALLLMRAEGRSADDGFLERLRLMYRLADELSNADGELPQVGDCDDGRVEFLLDDLEQMLLLPVEKRNSLRITNLLGLSSALLGEERDAGEDAKWYGLSQAANRSRRGFAGKTRGMLAKAWPDSGIALARGHQTEVLFFAMPNGILGRGSHTHNDKLSFVLRLAGHEIITDCGTCSYTPDPAKRNYFRSTEAHNTIAIDGAEQNILLPQPEALFRMGNEVQVSPVRVATQSGNIELQASHSGYRRLGVVHSRTIRVSDQGSVTIEDQLTGKGKHDFAVHFHFVPGLTVTAQEDYGKTVRYRIAGSHLVELVVSAPVEIRGDCHEVPISRTYGSAYSTKRIRLCGRGVLPLVLTTTITATASIAWDKAFNARGYHRIMQDQLQ